MSDNVTEFIVLGVSVLLLSLLIISATTLAKIGSKIPDSISATMEASAEDMNEAEFIKYDNTIVTGSDVLSATRKYKDSGVIIEVHTKNNSTEYVLSTEVGGGLDGSVQNLPSREDSYINPGAKFTGSVERNSNDVINRIVFVQTTPVEIPSAATLAPTAGGSVKVNQGEQADTVDLSLDDSNLANSVDVVFSDEVKESEGINSEASSYADTIQITINNFTSQIDDCLTDLKSFDTAEGENSQLVQIKSNLSVISEKIDTLETQIASSTVLNTDTKVELNRDLTKLVEKINSAISSIDKLSKSLDEWKETNSKWFIGYPVAESVIAELKDGTLTISGSGRTISVDNSPKWSAKLSEIHSIVFKSGVEPESLDDWFAGCENLESINQIPASVQSMNGTFTRCNKLTGTIKVLSDSITGCSNFRTCDGEIAPLTLVVKSDSKTEHNLSYYVNMVTKEKTGITLEVVK